MSRFTRLIDSLRSRKIMARTVEIIGMTMILGAWFFEWGLVGKWERIESGVSKTSSAIDQVMAPIRITSELRFQCAVSRAIERSKNRDSASAYYLADTWFDPDVRRSWLERFETNAAANDGMIMGLFLERYALGLKHVTMADSLKKELQDLWIDVAKRVVVETREGMSIKTPAVERMSALEANAFDSRLNVIANKLSLANLQNIPPVQHKANQSSHLHRVIFIIGSLFLIIGRIAEPIEHRRADKMSNSACN